MNPIFYLFAAVVLLAAGLAMPFVFAEQKATQLDRSVENGFYVLDSYSRLNYQPYVLCPGEKDLRFLQDPHPLYVKRLC